MTASRTTCAILQEVQEAYSYLPEDIMAHSHSAWHSAGSSVRRGDILLSLHIEPKGKYLIKVCDGTACHVKKSTDIIKTIQQELGLNESKKHPTTCCLH